MTDEKYVFQQDVKEKKRTARGSYNKKRAGGKTVRFPSDFLSNKEKNKMNSEVSSYNLNCPMNWQNFKKMPVDIQKEYIDKISNKFSLYRQTIAKELFMVYPQTFTKHMVNIGYKMGPGGNKKMKEDINGFRKWICRSTDLGTKESVVDITPLNLPEEIINELWTPFENKKDPDISDTKTYPINGTLEFNGNDISSVTDALRIILDKDASYHFEITFSKINKGETSNG